MLIIHSYHFNTDRHSNCQENITAYVTHMIYKSLIDRISQPYARNKTTLNSKCYFDLPLKLITLSLFNKILIYKHSSFLFIKNKIL